MGNSTLPLGGGDATRLSEIILQPGHSFVAGNVVRADENNPGVYLLAQADNAVNAEAVGMVETVAGDSFEVVYQGRVDLSNVGWADLPLSLPADQVWFLSDVNAGELTKTPPSTAGTVIKAMLVVTDDTLTFESGLLTGYIGVQIGGDNKVNINEIQPVGGIMPWAAPAVTPVPVGWALCDGQAISRTTFVDLFNVIGTDYGVGDGATTFNVPDLQRRVPVGQDASPPFDSVANTGGAETHTLTLSELPSSADHNHEHDSETTANLNLGGGTDVPLVQDGAGSTTAPEGSTEPGGGDTSFSILQPYLVINFIIRTTQQAAATLLDHNLSQHSDVADVSTPNDCDLLKFNAGSGEWEAAPGGTPAGAAVFSFRNQIINGRFDVWQRGTSFTSFTLYTADRWHTAGSEDGGTFTAIVNQRTFALGQTDVPGNPNRYVEFQNFITGGGTNASSIFIQRIEDVRTFSGKQVTVSFWAQGDTAGTVAVHFRQAFGTGGSPSALVEIPGQEIVLLNGVWQYYTLTFSIPSIAGKTLGTNNNDSLRLRFFTFSNAGSSASANLPNPVNFTGTMSLANVQVEEGDTATAFEIREPETEIALCQRYFSKAHDIDTAPFNMSAVNGVFDASQNNTPGIFETHAEKNAGGNATTMLFPVRMRSAPSLLVVQVQPSFGPGALQTLTANFIGEGSVSWRSQNTLVAFLWTADAEI